MQHSDGVQAQANRTERTDGISSLIHFGVVGFALLTFGVLMVWQGAAASADVFDFHFNIFGLLSLGSLISNVVAFILISRVRQRTETLMWFSAFLLSVMAWAVGEVLVRFSATREAAFFWIPATTPGSVLMPLALYMFVLSYIDTKLRFRPLTLTSFLGVATLFVYLDLHSRLITVYDPSKFILTEWGYVTVPGAAFAFIALWATLLPLAAIGQLYRFRRTVVDPILRKQVTLFMTAISIPLIGGALTDGLLPFFSLGLVPPLSVVLLTVMGGVISYGILRYRFFSFTPTTVASQILDTMNEAVIGLLPDFKIRYANAGAEQLLGLPTANFAQHHLADFLAHRIAGNGLGEKIANALDGKVFATLESIELRKADGRVVTVKMSITKLMDGKEPYGYLVVLSDITEIVRASELVERQVVKRTKELHEEQAKLRAAIEGLELGFILFDDEGGVIIQNKPLEKIFNLKGPVQSTRQLNDKMLDFDLGEHCEQVTKTGQSFVATDVGMGSKILQVFIGPVKVKDRSATKVIGVMLMIEDVTEEQVLARSKDEFFSIASHELRTPLTAIKGNTSIMIDYYKELLDKDESFKQMVYDIHESSGRLIDIVRDFLDVSRVEQGKMVFRPEVFDIDKIIEMVFYEFRTSIKGKDVNLETNIVTLGTLPKVWADKDRVMQILFNLVGNAVKFTDEGMIRVTAAVEGHRIRLEVSDTGRGIPVENQRLLFRKFQQAGASLLTRDTTKGTGLGLYISRLMAENMNCSLGLVSSREGKGSTFYLAIPIATKEQLKGRSQGVSESGKIDIATGLTVDER